MKPDLPRRLAAEAIGTALLLAVIIGSGIMGERLSGGNVALALLANSLATGCGLAVLILVLGPISGAHLNPAVTLVAAFDKDLRWREAAPYALVQIAAAYAGVAVALLVVVGCARQKIALAPLAVAAYITAAYWFTSSTSFANPAVTLARAASDTFAGIRLDDVPGFVAAQFCGAVAAMRVMRWLLPGLSRNGHTTSL